MMKRVTMLPTLALLLGLGATSAQAASAPLQPCITGDEAEGLTLALAPDLMRAIGTACGPALPAGSLLRQSNGAFIAKYQAAADDAWLRGRAAIGKLAGPDAAGLMDSDLARPMVGALVVPLLTKNLKTKDCPTIDRFVRLLSPLPPRNTAALVVTVLQLVNAEKIAKGGRPEVPLCPLGASR